LTEDADGRPFAITLWFSGLTWPLFVGTCVGLASGQVGLLRGQLSPLPFSRSEASRNG